MTVTRICPTSLPIIVCCLDLKNITDKGKINSPSNNHYTFPSLPPSSCRYLSEAGQQRQRGGEDCGGSGDVSICSSFDESEHEGISEGGVEAGEISSPATDTPCPPLSRSPHYSPGHHDPFASDAVSPRRRYSSADPGVSRSMQYSL